MRNNKQKKRNSPPNACYCIVVAIGTVYHLERAPGKLLMIRNVASRFFEYMSFTAPVLVVCFLTEDVGLTIYQL